MDLSKLLRDTSGRATGTWETPDPDQPKIQFRTRGFGEEYEDHRRSKLRAAAKDHPQARGNIDLLPSAIVKRCNVEALIEKSLTDVRGITEGGQPVPFDTICRLMVEDVERAGPLIALAFTAAQIATDRRDADLKDAKGNSGPASAGS